MKHDIYVLALLLAATAAYAEDFKGAADFSVAANKQVVITNSFGAPATPASFVGDFADVATGTLVFAWIHNGTRYPIKSVAVTGTVVFVGSDFFDGIWSQRGDAMAVSNTTAQTFTFTYSDESK